MPSWKPCITARRCAAARSTRACHCAAARSVSMLRSIDSKGIASFPPCQSCCIAAYRRVKPLSSGRLSLALPRNSAIPAARRENEGEVPRECRRPACADRDRRPDQALRQLHRRRQRQLQRGARRGAGLSGAERRRQVHHDADAGGLHDPHRRHRPHLRPRRADRRRGGAARAGLPAGGRADLPRNDRHRLPDLLRQGARLRRPRTGAARRACGGA